MDELKAGERRRLRRQVNQARDARIVRRAQAILWLDEGETVTAVAARQKVSRQAVYDWVDRFEERRGARMADRLGDNARSGRPPRRREAAEMLIDRVMNTDPRDLGYDTPVWTSALLSRQIESETGRTVSQRTVRRALRRLGYRYKRPRHSLSRRSPTWRQAKGGSNAD